MEYTIKSWNDLQDRLFENTYNSKIQRFRSDFIFRGVSDSSYKLITSLQRTCGDNLVLEKSLLRTFEKYSALEISKGNDFWNLISIAQHHGLPTRLLDWTFSPYVALHFATEDLTKYEADGVIWSINFIEATKLLPESLKKFLDSDDAVYFTTELLNKKVKNLEELAGFEKETEDIPYMMFFEPPSIDSRIVNQYALFSLLSSNRKSYEEWFSENNNLIKKIIIPKSLKMEFRDKLDQINMTERVIYPGLDGLCSWLKRHYTPPEMIDYLK